MADKSTHFLESLDFHPCDTPFNMDYFDLSCLTPTQQYSLNNHKVKVVREHQKYLNKNPEIRAVLQIIMRKLLLERPTHDINQFIGKYFSENWQDILDEVAKYVEKMPFATSGEPSSEKDMTSEIKQVTIKELRSRGSSKTSSPGVTEDGLITNVIKDLLEELLEDVYESVQQTIKNQIKDAEVEDGILTGAKSEDDDYELIFDLSLDFNSDFASDFELEDPTQEEMRNKDNTIIESLNNSYIV